MFEKVISLIDSPLSTSALKEQALWGHSGIGDQKDAIMLIVEILILNTSCHVKDALAPGDYKTKNMCYWSQFLFWNCHISSDLDAFSYINFLKNHSLPSSDFKMPCIVNEQKSSVKQVLLMSIMIPKISHFFLI